MTGDGAAQIPVQVPDHGDLWRVEWERQGPEVRDQGSKEPKSVTLRGECLSLPLVLERTVALAETGLSTGPETQSRTGRGWQLKLDYTLTKTGRSATPWSWAVHPLFAVEAGDTIELPESIHALRLEGSGGGRLGAVRRPSARQRDRGPAPPSDAQQSPRAASR